MTEEFALYKYLLIIINNNENSYDISELAFDIYSESVKGAPKFK